MKTNEVNVRLFDDKDHQILKVNFAHNPPDMITENSNAQITSDQSRRKPVFSILMPTYNQAIYIGESIKSVMNQSFEDWELVVCDDGSTDYTPQIVQEFARNNPKIIYVRKENGGTGSALNRALEESVGQWIGWLSSDDLYETNALETFKSAIDQNPDCKFFHAHYFLLDDMAGGIKDALPIQPPSLETPRELQVIKLLEINHFNGITICIDRKTIMSMPRFNTGNRNAQDYEMWLRLSAQFRWKFIPERVSSTRLHGAVGQVAFPQAGVYDSGAAAQAFINEFPFEYYFPLLNLTNPEHAWTALLAGIQLALKPDSFIYQGVGYVPAFLERMLEWLTKSESRAVREALMPQLASIRAALDGASLPPAIDTTLKMILDGPTEPFVYKPYDPFELIHQNMLNLAQSGNIDGTNLIFKFLRKVKRLRPEFEALASGNS